MRGVLRFIFDRKWLGFLLTFSSELSAGGLLGPSDDNDDDDGGEDDDGDDDVYLHRHINLVASLALKLACSSSPLLTWCENHLSALTDDPQY